MHLILIAPLLPLLFVLQKKRDENNWLPRVLSSVPSVVLSVCAGNPFDVLKVRYQRGKPTTQYGSADPRTFAALVRSEGMVRG